MGIAQQIAIGEEAVFFRRLRRREQSQEHDSREHLMHVLVIGRSDGPDFCSITCRKCDEVFHVKTNNARTKKVGAKRMLELLRIVVPVVQPDSTGKTEPQ